MRGDIRLDGLSERERNVRAVLRIAQQNLIVGIAEISRFEQHGWSTRAAKHVECGKAVRFGPEFEAHKKQTGFLLPRV